MQKTFCCGAASIRAKYVTLRVLQYCSANANANMQNANANMQNAKATRTADAELIDVEALVHYVQQVEGGLALCIDLRERDLRVQGAKMLSIGMYVSNDEEQWGGEELVVEWSADGLTYEEVQAVTDAMYCEQAFTAQLREILYAAGFSKSVAYKTTTSEGGMQEEERASYDGNMLADEMRWGFN